ncbi:MAG: HAD-IB family phosphatase [Methyloprofundus sp.]|nr:HAD-IB family phosphatase [Methyloprofundus sp.]
MKFDIVCFDFDSTLSTIEGIDALAEKAGCGVEMAALTNAAMNGEVALEDVYAQRLNLIRPNKAEIDWLASVYIENRVAGVKEVFEQLHAAGVSIHIISGGLKAAILPMAAQLNVPANQVHAVDLSWDQSGEYISFDEQCPLAKSGGKAEVCLRLNPKKLKLAMIGDGKTDMEAKTTGAFCIGFGGVVARPLVQEQADVFINESDLQAVLPYLF